MDVVRLSHYQELDVFAKTYGRFQYQPKVNTLIMKRLTELVIYFLWPKA
ncbi:MAG: hypothetical protein JWP06_1057 [Candidatus Saccharibacteria bacterium]|nr:hypothetical protein [Candidatus Saccharibacteria bacterium]